ncbi:MAG: Adenylate cyclase [Myxococcaceae bacterium]|nr:Adenylate cyclase [Myxococcaceae bacterium]
MADRLSLAPFGVSERRAMLVGRATEMHDLDDAIRAVRDKGQTRVVTLVGATGIGKTRLVRDFLVKLRGQGERAPRVFRGSAREQEQAYGVIARVLRARFGIVEGTDPEAAKAQVRAQSAEVLEDRKVGDVIYFLGQLLELEFQDSPLIRAVLGDPKQVVSLRRAIIKHFFEADAASGQVPLVLVFDDLQHAHEDSLELLAYLLENLEGKILVICLARPDMIARKDGWLKFGGARHKAIELAPLSEMDASAAMQDLLAPCGDSPAVDELIEAACTLAGGNPALLEQMVRIFLDMGVLEVEDELAEQERWKIHSDKLAGVRLPLTVEDAVQARIAALAPAERELLERAAAMGGVFWLGGLLSIQRLHQATPELWAAGTAEDIVHVKSLLDDLVERDYVLRLSDSTFVGDQEYVFKHNLEREALVRVTPPGTARKYHAAIAEWLSFKEHVRTHEEYVAMLARHREQAGSMSQAAAAYLEAADVARSRYANTKAVEYYALGLALLDRGVEADADQWIRALHHYGDVLQSLGRNEEALVAFRSMLTRAYRLDQRTKGGAAHSRIGRLFRETGRLEEATNHLDAALSLFEESKDDRGIASTVDDLGKLHWLRGDYHKALEFTQRALAMRRKIGDRRSIALSLNNLGLVFQDSGQFVQALDSFEQALKIRREIGDLVGVTISLNNLGTVAQDQRDDRRALSLFQEAYEVAKETGDRNRIALVLTNLGETWNRLGDTDKAIYYLKQAEELADELGDKMGLAEAVRGLGKAYLAQRDFTKARECTARAVEIFTEIESRVQMGVALRSLGEVTAAASAGGEGLKSARGYLLKSITIFEEIGNDVELARSCRAYADMLRGTSEYQTDPNVIREASGYAKRADEIFQKLKISAFGLEPDAFFAAR